MKKQTNGEEEISMHDEMRRAFALLSGKWKLEIMWLLSQRVYRFGELRKAIPGITQHMLTAQLRELEADGLVSRTVFAEVPPRVEYEITQKARGLGPTMEALTAWWSEYGRSIPVKSTSRGRKAKVSKPKAA
ncbi:winged helix-turn-helix transcriptional regulator [Ralstonia pseudosolanacearum]|uniref:winged helix-turn-helix transcriptional regulator n=1 Tax=Ralstonia pseudosolanacearum TaxID=1310165 RepID=UPI0007D75814|nr:helix-turn-helix domain-containing protein [Ralstonia pseudosolanacearum]MDC6294993.1 helix-turn-helix domain-containing protein [Ralstonia pseudosolanacearum]MDD7791631.1 helix-turn-helix domain-containing protein [Ralstonia pseudosolanacearum]MDN3370165.1 helix-turn-helix domain-containing protein [Ralstonia pseudosolanacearum]OAK93135.1 MarR family transcriptional regulator [Ralstonia pseudosolanacearum]QOK88093.1 helix-turn-helix transcriptional regulator [Ralstonia pseudosolanacearum]